MELPLGVGGLGRKRQAERVGQAEAAAAAVADPEKFTGRARAPGEGFDATLGATVPSGRSPKQRPGIGSFVSRSWTGSGC